MSIVKIFSRLNTKEVLYECDVPNPIQVSRRVYHALEKSIVSGADLRYANLLGTDLRDADLSGTTLIGTTLSGTTLSGADLRDADLRGTTLIGTTLIGTTLSGADLSGADLSGADLRDADLSGTTLIGTTLSGTTLSGAALSDADLSGAGRATDEQAIANLDRVREIILDNAARLGMNNWHQTDDWKGRTCAEETLCKTMHCLAGWLQVCSTDAKVRDMEPQLAGVVSAPVAAKMFFGNANAVVEWLRDRKYVGEIEDSNRLAAERKAKRNAVRSAP